MKKAKLGYDRREPHMHRDTGFPRTDGDTSMALDATQAFYGQGAGDVK